MWFHLGSIRVNWRDRGVCVFSWPFIFDLKAIVKVWNNLYGLDWFGQEEIEQQKLQKVTKLLNLLLIFVFQQIYYNNEVAWKENLVKKVLWVVHKVALSQHSLKNLKNLFSYKFVVLIQFEGWNALLDHKFLEFFKLGFAFSFLKIFNSYYADKEVRNALSHVQVIEQVYDNCWLLI